MLKKEVVGCCGIHRRLKETLSNRNFDDVNHALHFLELELTERLMTALRCLDCKRAAIAINRAGGGFR